MKCANIVSHNCATLVKVFLLLAVVHIENLRRVSELNALGALDVLICNWWLLANAIVNILQTEHPHWLRFQYACFLCSLQRLILRLHVSALFGLVPVPWLELFFNRWSTHYFFGKSKLTHKISSINFKCCYLIKLINFR